MTRKINIDIIYLIGILWFRERSLVGWGSQILGILTYTYWPHGFKDITNMMVSFGRILLITNTHLTCLIFCGNVRGSSPFWKCVMGAAEAAKMGFRWHVGDGKKVRFWDDCWFDSCSLAIQFWSVYSIVNEQEKSINEMWDGENLKLTFRRTVD
jgi:hypothetical protein